MTARKLLLKARCGFGFYLKQDSGSASTYKQDSGSVGEVCTGKQDFDFDQEKAES